MITISDDAMSRLKTIRPPRGQVLRLEPRRNRRLGLVFGWPSPSDQVVRDGVREVVRIPHVLSEALDGAILGLTGPGDDPGRFTLTSPGS